MADLFDPLASLTNDGASQLSVGYREHNEGWGGNKKQAHTETLNTDNICVTIKTCNIVCMICSRKFERVRTVKEKMNNIKMICVPLKAGYNITCRSTVDYDTNA